MTLKEKLSGKPKQGCGEIYYVHLLRLIWHALSELWKFSPEKASWISVRCLEEYNTSNTCPFFYDELKTNRERNVFHLI